MYSKTIILFSKSLFFFLKVVSSNVLWNVVIETSDFKKRPAFLTILNYLVNKCFEIVLNLIQNTNELI